MNISDIQKVTDVNKRSHSPDLRYSEKSEQWTMNEKVQDALGLDDSRGLDMYIGVDEETGEQVVLVEIVDADEAEFFTGAGNIFVARRLADITDHHSFALDPIEEMEGEIYALREWEGDSPVLDSMMPVDGGEEEVDDDFTDLGSEEETEFAVA